MLFFKGKEKGFTLVEIIVYVSVIAVLVVSISAFMLWQVTSNSKIKAMREVADSARRAMDIMASEIREANSIYSPTATSTQLSLETTKYLPEGEDKSYVDFFLCGQQICLKKEGQAPDALTSEKTGVSNFSFTQIVTGQRPSVQINLVLNYNNPAGKPENQASVNLTSTVSLRNY